VVETVIHLKVRSCLIDSEAVYCDERGVTAFQMKRARGIPLRLRLLELKRRAPTARADRGAQGNANEHPTQEPPRRASERTPGAPRGCRRVPARLQDGVGGDYIEAAGIALPIWAFSWLKFKNPDAPAVKREVEEDWR